VQRLRDYAQGFGFDQPIPFDLPVAPSRFATHPQMTPPELASTAFGQGELQATPLLMALAGAAVANGGAMPAPYLVAEIRGPEGTVQRPHLPGSRLRQVMRPATAATLNRLMVESVDEGYARPAQIAGVKVGGKTGTAEVGAGRTPHAWFVGYAPADNPRVAVAVILEHAGSGTDVATPVGRRILEAALGGRRSADEDFGPGLAWSPAATSGAFCPLPGAG
jgi:peptidoglycan glycosyltransferase